MGQIVPHVKANSSHDRGKAFGHTVLMGEADSTASDAREFLAAFKARLRRIQGKRTDPEMAQLLGINPDRYKKLKNRTKGGFPIWLLPKLRLIAAMDYRELIEGEKTVEAKKPAPARSKSSKSAA